MRPEPFDKLDDGAHPRRQRDAAGPLQRGAPRRGRRRLAGPDDPAGDTRHARRAEHRRRAVLVCSGELAPFHGRHRCIRRGLRARVPRHGGCCRVARRFHRDSPTPQRDFPLFDEEPGADLPSKGRFEASESTVGDDIGRPVPTLASSDERLTEVDFARLTADELAALAPLLRMLCVNPPRRLSRRRRRHRRGDRLDVRASLRHSTRSGGDPAVPIRRTRKWTPRRLVALLDISGSMEPYARAYLHLLWGAATRAHAEVFVFGTRLTRLTRALRNANPDLALERAAALMPDWSGGTRIGRAVREFMDLYGRRGMARGAVVLIVSDGWERDDPSVLARQMVALGRHAHRVVWANPRAAAPGFAPLAGGMAAALPHVDAFISGHSADALTEVVRALGDTQPRPAPTSLSEPR